jgi:NADH-quinone oxidoreductase subunit F
MSFEEGRATKDDLSLLEMHTKWLAPGHTFCGLAPGAMAPLQSALKYFHDDFERHITTHGCPWSKKSSQQKVLV